LARTGPGIHWPALIGVMLALSLTFSAGGCGPNRPRVYPVSGEFFWEGKPAAGAVVVFHPADAPPATNETPAQGKKPMARVKSDGSFTLSTYGINDGAPAGRYHITLVWTQFKAPGSDEEVDLLPPEYANLQTSPVEIVEIRAEKNVLPAFRLSK
jgi:hypothetical protein